VGGGGPLSICYALCLPQAAVSRYARLARRRARDEDDDSGSSSGSSSSGSEDVTAQQPGSAAADMSAAAAAAAAARKPVSPPADARHRAALPVPPVAGLSLSAQHAAVPRAGSGAAPAATAAATAATAATAAEAAVRSSGALVSAAAAGPAAGRADPHAGGGAVGSRPQPPHSGTEARRATSDGQQRGYADDLSGSERGRGVDVPSSDEEDEEADEDDGGGESPGTPPASQAPFSQTQESPPARLHESVESLAAALAAALAGRLPGGTVPLPALTAKALALVKGPLNAKVGLWG
jgi:hypothetical protein